MEEKIFFANSKGNKLSAILTNPSNSKDKPIIIVAHGFSSTKEGTSADLAKRLQKHFISSFRFDFYGHGESEGKFEEVTISEAVDNILHAIEYLQLQGYKKIGLIGSSFGGIASIMTASQTNNLYVLALRSPVSNYYLKETETKTKEELQKWKSLGYRVYTTGDGRKLSLNYSFFEDFKNNDGFIAAKKIKVPTLIVHGDHDETVPIKQSIETAKIINNCKLEIIKGADHRYSDPSHKEKALQTIIDFIVKQSSI